MPKRRTRHKAARKRSKLQLMLREKRKKRLMLRRKLRKPQREQKRTRLKKKFILTIGSLLIARVDRR